MHVAASVADADQVRHVKQVVAKLLEESGRENLGRTLVEFESSGEERPSQELHNACFVRVGDFIDRLDLPARIIWNIVQKVFVRGAKRLQHTGDAVAHWSQLDKIVAVIRGEYIKRAVNLYQIDAGLVEIFEIKPSSLKTANRECVYRQLADPSARAAAQRKGARAGEPAIDPDAVMSGDALHDEVVVQGKHP